MPNALSLFVAEFVGKIDAARPTILLFFIGVYNNPERDDMTVRCGVRVAMFFVLRAFVVCGRDIDIAERCSPVC